MREIPRPGERYRHFKGKEYQIIAVAEHTETRERLVIYQALYGGYGIWARPLPMFLSEVDRAKYPDARQRYRFEKIADAPGDPCAESREPSGNESEPAGTGKSREDAAVTGRSVESAEDTTPMSPLLGEFLDAETAEQKLAVLRKMSGVVGQREITSMYMALDLIPVSGTLEEQLDAIRQYIALQNRFDAARMRGDRRDR